jgi:preprotein translocase subunit YajC
MAPPGPRKRLRSRGHPRRTGASANRGEVTQVQGLDSSLIFLVLVGVVFYLMLYRPNKKRIQQHRALIDSVGVGDEVVTIGGLFGTVRSITDDQFHLELAPGTTVRLAKSAIARKIEPSVENEEEEADVESAGGASA